jgi:hypothetical protein
MPQRPTDSVHAMLREAEAELTRRLQEACEAEAKGVATESAAEIRQLEDTLLAAAMAAERTIAARRLIRASSPQQEELPPDRLSADAIADPETPKGTSVRQFEDKQGRTWRAWPVTPDVTSARTGSRRSLGDFQEGWICFEALDNSGRRRLPRRGRRWSDVRPEELPELLEAAVTVPARKTTQQEIRSRADIGKLS